MEISMWVGVGAGIMAILGGIFVAIKFIIKGFLYELRPNGGQSLKDQVNRLESRVDEIYLMLSGRNK
ncbi:hypothetical protein EB001_02220 [bacterium]|nr:hypothetical protein [bacterium]